jgi:hypothetical protein
VAVIIYNGHFPAVMLRDKPVNYDSLISVIKFKYNFLRV